MSLMKPGSKYVSLAAQQTAAAAIAADTTKASLEYVNTQLGLKADSSALALKADLVQINAIGSDNWLKLFAQDPESMLYGTLQRNQSNAITSGPVIWPDGTAGMYTATIDASYNVPSSYTVTYGSTVTVTQPMVTRNSDGYITVRPALTITRT